MNTYLFSQLTLLKDQSNLRNSLKVPSLEDWFQAANLPLDKTRFQIMDEFYWSTERKYNLSDVYYYALIQEDEHLYSLCIFGTFNSEKSDKNGCRFDSFHYDACQNLEEFRYNICQQQSTWDETFLDSFTTAQLENFSPEMAVDIFLNEAQHFSIPTLQWLISDLVELIANRAKANEDTSLHK